MAGPGPATGDRDDARFKVVRYEVADRIATITLDRPDRLNAWTGRMHTEYRRAVSRPSRTTPSG